jgi:hypothetical protein
VDVRRFPGRAVLVRPEVEPVGPETVDDRHGSARGGRARSIMKVGP